MESRKPNRRAAMTAIAAAAIMPTAALAADGPDPVFAAIEAVKIAVAALSATCDVVERHDLAWFAQRKKGDDPKTAEHQRAEAEQERACEALDEAMQKLVETIPTTRAGAQSMVSYFQKTTFEVGLGDDLVCPLLESLAQAVAA
jgi:hypothetical protein